MANPQKMVPLLLSSRNTFLVSVPGCRCQVGSSPGSGQDICSGVETSESGKCEAKTLSL